MQKKLIRLEKNKERSKKISYEKYQSSELYRKNQTEKLIKWNNFQYNNFLNKKAISFHGLIYSLKKIKKINSKAYKELNIKNIIKLFNKDFPLLIYNTTEYKNAIKIYNKETLIFYTEKKKR